MIKYLSLLSNFVVLVFLAYHTIQDGAPTDNASIAIFLFLIAHTGINIYVSTFLIFNKTEPGLFRLWLRRKRMEEISKIESLKR